MTHKLGKRKRPATNRKLSPQLLDCVKDIRLIGLLGFLVFLAGYSLCWTYYSAKVEGRPDLLEHEGIRTLR